MSPIFAPQARIYVFGAPRLACVSAPPRFRRSMRLLFITPLSFEDSPLLTFFRPDRPRPDDRPQDSNTRLGGTVRQADISRLAFLSGI